MERQVIELLEAQINRLEGYPEALPRLRSHLNETRAQQTQVEECLHRLGTDPSMLKDSAMKLTANVQGMLHVMAGESANPNHRHVAHVADVFLWVTDLEEVVSAANAAGLAITRGPERYASTPLATTEVVVEDLDGYWFCFAVAHLP